MAASGTVTSVGAACFGAVTGYITYRTMARSASAPQSGDLTAVLAAVGGGAVTALGEDRGSDTFGWYAIGLAGGMAVYLLLHLLFNGRRQTGAILGDREDPGPR